ncbi:SRPBCC family protein [Actinoallomurus sp. CA-150999]|uniref:SRPBCC family protein n=1 Tax=Actinoallomurus sp. CA-150999 TaxID=3239887 RepID=UPI003D8AE260
MATVEVRRMMGADPQDVYELIADVTRMGEWSPESTGAEWLSGEPGAVGSTFRGDNRRPWVKWSTICTVTVADRGKRFAFTVKAAGRPVATWEFEIAPRDGGCEVTERTLDQRSLFYKVTSVVTTGLGRRSVRNRWTMERTLDALAHAVEH